MATSNVENMSMETLKLKVTEASKSTLPAKAAKDLDHEILLGVANNLSTFIPEMMSFKSSFESFKVEMTALQNKLKKVEDENSQIKKENVQIKKENASMKKQILNHEINVAQKSVIIKGLPTLKGKEKNETSELLQDSFDKVLKELKVEGKVQISDIYRLKSKDKKGKSPLSPVKVDFLSMIDKRAFFKNISKIRESSFKDIQINQCIVKSLESEFKELDKLNHDLRKASPGLRAKIIIVNQKYKLFVKAPTDQKYSEYKN